MSIADAVRARALEVRVAELERRLDALEQGSSDNPSNASMWGRIGMLQSQINMLRRANGDVVKADDAA